MRFIAAMLLVSFGASSLWAQSSNVKRIDRVTEWEVLYGEGTTADEYEKILDYFGIEVGVIGKDGKIQYVKKFSALKPEKRIGKKSLENRISTGWKRGTLQALDRKILTRVGVYTEDKELRHYFPSELEHKLFELEHDYKDLKPEEIKRTRFQVRPKADEKGEYEFFVVEQEPLKIYTPPNSRHRSPGEVDPDKESTPTIEQKEKSPL
jgi:hypothetical protein